jgi:5-formyltetrahydrofolate cyclo-ligase
MKKIQNPFSFSALVVEGQHVGTPFGIATANLDVTEHEAALAGFDFGVYGVEVSVDGVKYAGVMHYGPRLTFGACVTIEVHIFRFDKDIYGQTLAVHVVGFLRAIKKFANADMLFTQIEKDVLMTEKFFLRQDVLALWKTVTPAMQVTWTRKVIKYCVQNDFIAPTARIFAFAPMKDEVDYVPKMCTHFMHNVCTFPKIENGEMHFYASAYADLKPGMFGILEPKTTIKILPRAGDVVFVPGVAATQTGQRLGRGGGFYDRFLAALPAGVQTILIVPEFAKQASLPMEAHDVLVETVLFV